MTLLPFIAYDPSSMGKRHDEPPPSSSKTTLAVMVVGALLVAGLIGWALTRTVEPATSLPAASDSVATTAPIATDSGFTSAPMTTAPTSNPISEVPTAFDPALAAAPPTQHESDKVSRMAVEDLRAKLNRGGIVVVDVRDQSSYERSHIPGSIHIPLASVEANLSQLPKDKPIVTYCT